MIAVNQVYCLDFFDLCGAIAPGSVEFPLVNIPSICYNSVHNIVSKWDMNEREICRLYTEEGYTLRRIAALFNSNHHMIRRILARNGVEITQAGRKRAPFSDEHRRKMSLSMKGRPGWAQGKTLSESFRRANMKGKLYSNINFDKYPDYERLLFLTHFLSKRKAHIGYDDSVREPFLDKFYFDAQFNAIYDAWISSGKNKWYRPTLDHKTSQANGGMWDLSNLQFLTWFENRAKAEMNDDEWLAFCESTNTHSDLFIRVNND